jgi:protein-disulfide isomerase
MVNARQAKSAREKAAAMRAETARQESRRRTITIVSAVVAVIVVAVGAGVLIQTARHNQEMKQQAATAPPANLTNGGFLVDASSTTPTASGTAGATPSAKPAAKVTIETWEDFQCPACQQFEKENADQIAQWVADGTVKIMYHPVAILDRSSTTNYSTRSLNAAAAVINTAPESFLKFHKLLFDNQPPEGGDGLPDSQLIDYAVQAGAKRADVEPAVTGQKYLGWTAKVSDSFDQRFTKPNKRAGTPTVLVNGTQVADWGKDQFKAAVEAAAKK